MHEGSAPWKDPAKIAQRFNAGCKRSIAIRSSSGTTSVQRSQRDYLGTWLLFPSVKTLGYFQTSRPDERYLVHAEKIAITMSSAAAPPLRRSHRSTSRASTNRHRGGERKAPLDRPARNKGASRAPRRPILQRSARRCKSRPSASRRWRRSSTRGRRGPPPSAARPTIRTEPPAALCSAA